MTTHVGNSRYRRAPHSSRFLPVLIPGNALVVRPPLQPIGLNNERPDRFEVHGAKNAVGMLMIASMLLTSTTRLTNVPIINDVYVIAEALNALGATVEIDARSRTIVITPPSHEDRTPHLPASLMHKSRAQLLLLAPIWHWFGFASVPTPGGDCLGGRINQEIRRVLEFFALSHAGITDQGPRVDSTDEEPWEVFGRRGNTDRPRSIVMEVPAVTATQLAILLSVAAPGKTIISGGALEPEVMELVKFLRNAGASIQIDTNNSISIEGGNSLEGLDHEIIPDRIATFTYAAFALASMCTAARRGKDTSSGQGVVIENCDPSLLTAELELLGKAGANIEKSANSIRIFPTNELNLGLVEADFYPGVASDNMAMMLLLGAATNGVTIHDRVVGPRSSYSNDAAVIGVNIKRTNVCPDEVSECRYSFDENGFPHTQVVEPHAHFRGANFISSELPSGTAVPGPHDTRAAWMRVFGALLARPNEPSFLDGGTLQVLGRSMSTTTLIQLVRAGAKFQSIPGSALMAKSFLSSPAGDGPTSGLTNKYVVRVPADGHDPYLPGGRFVCLEDRTTALPTPRVGRTNEIPEAPMRPPSNNVSAREVGPSRLDLCFTP